MKEKQKIHYSVWKRFVDGIYTCKDIEELLADKKTDRSKTLMKLLLVYGNW